MVSDKSSKPEDKELNTRRMLLEQSLAEKLKMICMIFEGDFSKFNTMICV